VALARLACPPGKAGTHTVYSIVTIPV
jgi:hypothetical protein